jgi:hypothetical protein
LAASAEWLFRLYWFQGFFILPLVEVPKSRRERQPDRAILFETTWRVVALILTLGAFLSLGILFLALWQSRFNPILTGDDMQPLALTEDEIDDLVEFLASPDERGVQGTWD